MPNDRSTSPPPAVLAWEGRWLRIRTRGTWEFVERVHADGMAVIIVAVTPERKLLFVEQFRVPLQQRTIEMPAGLVGDDDHEDTLEKAAARELLEETGWHAAHVEVLMEGPSSSGMSTERIAFCRATGLSRVNAGGGDATEDITVHEVPVDEAAAWLVAKMAEGFAMDPKLWAGLWFVSRQPDGRLIDGSG